jgi:V-type H+-transporting ATPase subunit D
MYHLSRHRRFLTGTCFRLKKVQGKKKRDAEAAEARKKLEGEGQSDAADQTERIQLGEDAPSDLLNAKDEDVIF